MTAPSRDRARLLAAVALSALALTGCGSADPAADAPETTAETTAEDGTTPGAEQPDGAAAYTGPYDAAFAAALGVDPGTEGTGAHEETEVTLTAVVHEVVSPAAVAITDRDDASVAPLLVVLENPDDTLAPGDPVEVTGTVHAAYNVPAAEENLGEAPDPEVLAHYDGRPYLEATRLDSPVPAASTPAG